MLKFVDVGSKPSSILKSLLVRDFMNFIADPAQACKDVNMTGTENKFGFRNSTISDTIFGRYIILINYN